VKTYYKKRTFRAGFDQSIGRVVLTAGTSATNSWTITRTPPSGTSIITLSANMSGTGITNS